VRSKVPESSPPGPRGTSLKQLPPVFLSVVLCRLDLPLLPLLLLLHSYDASCSVPCQSHCVLKTMCIYLYNKLNIMYIMLSVVIMGELTKSAQ